MEKERNNLKQDTEATFTKLASELAMFDQNHLNRVPKSGGWTAGQIAEHIIICGNGIPDRHTGKPSRAYNEKIPAIKKVFLNFELKFETARSIAPGPSPHDKQKLLNQIEGVKEVLTAIIVTKPLEEICLDMELPTFGKLTRYEWLRFILFHTQRHTNQLLNLKSNIH